MNPEILILPEGTTIRKSKKNYCKDKYVLKIHNITIEYFNEIAKDGVNLSITDKLNILLKKILTLIDAQAGYLSSTTFQMYLENLVSYNHV